MDVLERRMGAIAALFFLLLVLAAGRTLYLGAVHSGTLRQVARNQQLVEEPVPARRGSITDSGGFDLAVSEPAKDISVTPYLIADPPREAQRLAPLLGQTEVEVLRKLTERSGFVYLARALPARQAEAVLALKIPGIAGAPVMRRVYPRGALAAQLLGFVGTEGKGLAGLEYSRNALLAGRSGQRRVVSDAIGQPVSITETHPAAPGTPISLTLDANIQQRAEDVLGAVGRVFSPKDATAIVMEPGSGAILAMANWPQMNANHPGASSTTALADHAVSFDYEPGSTFKAVTVAGALEQGSITSQTAFNVPDKIQVADRTIHDDTEHPEETLTAGQILAQSSNVGAIKIGMLEGAPSFSSWVSRFGFGTRTGTGLADEEQGQVPPLDKYSGSSMGNLPIGQGQLVTPLQMATAYAAIADGGILRPPRIIRSIGDEPQPVRTGRRVISTGTAAAVRQMLRGVLAPGGTASQVSIPGYQLAGKTGTANKIDPATGEYSKTAFVTSFIGFAPASHPKLLCAVVVDEPQSTTTSGATVAAPAFGQIMSFALPYLRIAPG